MKLKRNIFIIFGAWTLIIGLSLSISYFQARDAARSSATAAARSLFTKDVLYRKWNAGHGGVYVPITESAQPNPYLTQIRGRDVETLSGKRLTLINPAYMTRQVHELGLESKGVGGDITSLDPIRPANAPDSWQKKALKEFEQGANEYISVEKFQGKERLRFMRPLMTEKACLKCHARQGYELGDVRGGISITLPMGPYISGMWKQMTFLGSVYGIIWFLGLSGLGFGYMFNRRGMIERRKAEEELRENERRIQAITTSARDAIIMMDPQGNISYWNPMAESIFGYLAEEVMGQDLHFLLAPKRYHEAWKKAFLHFQETGNGNAIGQTIELAAVCKDGREIPICLSLSSVLLQEEWYAVGIVRDVTERKQMERSLQASEKRLYDITQTMGEGLYVMDNQGHITFVNSAAAELLGYSEKELLGRVGHDLFHVHDQQGKQVPLQQCPIFHEVVQGRTYRGEDFFQRRDKSIFPVEVIGQPMWENGQVAGSVTAFRDITDRKKVEESLKESEERFRTTLENLPGAVFTHDLEGSIVLVNRAACRQSGYSREELLQMNVEDIDPQAPARGDILDIWRNIKPGQSSMVETTHITKDGSQYPAEVLINAITIDRQPVMLAVAFDITERKEAEKRLRFLATTDELTSMWNRRRFTQATRNELERAHRYQQIFSFLMLDIDYFKSINDTYGHGAGDEVLRHIGHLIRQSLRQVDVPGRYGGEEFAVILPHTDSDSAYVTAERIRQCVENTPAVYKNIDIPFSVSIGVATYQDGIENEDEIYKMADDALYEAKRKGRNLTVVSPGK